MKLMRRLTLVAAVVLAGEARATESLSGRIGAYVGATIGGASAALGSAGDAAPLSPTGARRWIDRDSLQSRVKIGTAAVDYIGHLPVGRSD